MKKTGIILSALMLAAFVLSGCKAEEGYVKINQENFPDSALYYAAMDKDLDKDSKLSPSEIGSTTSIFLYRAKDFTGLDIFTNLESISISESENIKCDFKKYTNLSTLSINGTCESDRIDLSGNIKLETLYIDSANLKRLVLPKDAPLKDISIKSTLLESIDLNEYKGLQKIKIESNELLEGLDFRDFPELAELKCSFNRKLHNLNVSNCPELKVFECTSDALSDLNVSGCENIEELKCDDNGSLTSLDLSGFPKLTALHCSRNYITELDLSCCPELTELFCVYNSLTSLDLSSNLKLKHLTCGGNPFKEFDVSCCSNLESLSCWGCQLTSLNFTGCSNLRSLICSDNKLTSLDLTACPKLSGLYCDENNLTSLDISKCPELIELINAANPEESKDGKGIYYHDDNLGHISVDKGTELVIT